MNQRMNQWMNVHLMNKCSFNEWMIDQLIEIKNFYHLWIINALFTWIDFCGYISNVHIFINIFFRFVSSAVYYGMNFNTKNLTGNLYLNIFFSGLVEIPALIFVVLVHNKLGRRLTVSLLMSVAGVFSFAILILDLAGMVYTYWEVRAKKI